MRRRLSCLILLLLAACAVPFDDPRFQQQQAGLMQTALRPAEEASREPRLWYVGIGLYGESWSENDVSELATRLQRDVSGFLVVPLVFSNQFGNLPQRFPAPDQRSVERAMQTIARHAGPGDVIFVYVSSHGSPGVLARSARGLEMEPVRVDELRDWLASLGMRRTVLVLSACFSGSFIPVLRADSRIIITAARRDRTSFGCKPGARHTVFGEALLDALAEPHESLRTVVGKTLADVAARERGLGVSRPSEPQVFVGPAMAQFYDQPVF